MFDVGFLFCSICTMLFEITLDWEQTGSLTGRSGHKKTCYEYINICETNILNYQAQQLDIPDLSKIKILAKIKAYQLWGNKQFTWPTDDTK